MHVIVRQLFGLDTCFAVIEVSLVENSGYEEAVKKEWR
jgi:hypothetical protein